MAKGPRTRSWEHPDCPNCESDVYVAKHTDGKRFTCHACDESFPRAEVF